VGSASLEMLKTCLDMILSNQLWVALRGAGPCHPNQFHDSVKIPENALLNAFLAIF